jgi:hypothetical protein
LNSLLTSITSAEEREGDGREGEEAGEEEEEASVG